MKITFVRPRLELQNYIESFWAFESPTSFPAGDRSVVTPNGCSKLIIPYENSITRLALGNVHVSQERRLYFVGNRDSATLLQSSSRKTGFIAIEFRPHGAFPIFGIPMSETFNGIWDCDELFATWGRDVREDLNNLERLDQKVAYVQDRLIALLREDERPNPIVEYCVNALKSADGRMAIWQLAKQTGYSRRYLDQLFKQYVGLITESPRWHLSLSKVLSQMGRGAVFRAGSPVLISGAHASSSMSSGRKSDGSLARSGGRDEGPG